VTEAFLGLLVVICEYRKSLAFLVSRIFANLDEGTFITIWDSTE
jgi:hypothetical protein